MSKIESPFTVDEKAEFRFALILESRSVEAHSLMDSDSNKEEIKRFLDFLAKGEDLIYCLNRLIKKWKEEHKG